MAESIQKQLTRVRPPRVRITYDVEVGNAIIQKELPFVMGILADLSGNRNVERETPLTPYKERSFITIDRDNFDKVLADAQPALAFSVSDQLSGEEEKTLGCSLDFRSMEDFEPASVARRIPALKALLDIRQRLQDFAAKADSNDALHDLSRELVKSADKRGNLKTALQLLRQTPGAAATTNAPDAAAEETPQENPPVHIEESVAQQEEKEPGGDA